MNASFLAQPSIPALFNPACTQTPKNTALSVGQLLDVELGLYLLSQLLPTAPPDALPTLISNKGNIIARPSHLVIEAAEIPETGPIAPGALPATSHLEFSH
jgi:hypothetical protein